MYHVDVAGPVFLAASMAAHTDVLFLDYRPLAITSVQGLTSVGGDILRLPLATRSVPSLSCLHVAEHVGLGRYGEPLDPRGTAKAALELTRVLAPGGILLFAIPVGRPGTYFNAHRVFAAEEVLDLFASLDLLEMAGVLDDGTFVPDASPDLLDTCVYGCGMFVFASPGV